MRRRGTQEARGRPFLPRRGAGSGGLQGQRLDVLAEGYYTALALQTLQEKYKVELPICSVVYAVLYNGLDPREGLDTLLSRALKQELS